MSKVRIWYQPEGSKTAIPIHGIEDLAGITPFIRWEDCPPEDDGEYNEWIEITEDEWNETLAKYSGDNSQ